MKKTNYIISLLTILIFFISCTNTTDNESGKYYCDAETLSIDKQYFVNPSDTSQVFNGGSQQSNDYAHSGDFSMKLDNKHEYGFTIEIKNLQMDTRYKISVWRLIPKQDKTTKSTLVISSKENNFYQKESKSTNADDTDWELIEKWITIPPNSDVKNLKIYIWNPKEETVYFDDLLIEQVDDYVKFSDIPNLNIFIDTIQMNKLELIREQAFDKEILETTDDSWVKAMIFTEDDIFKSEMRLKGDLLDHLKGKKWSFRIKLKKQASWLGMRTFSIQNPKSRYFIAEWLAHQIMRQEGLLTPKYGFIPVALNGESLGLYAYEEHFEKQLVESQNRREGPILKFTEESFWVLMKVKNVEDTLYEMPVYEACAIKPFKEKKTFEAPNLTDQFLIAQNLLYQYKWCLAKPSEIFDIDKVAKLYAMVDVTKMYHATRWHNQRFYYNPIISKIEIIGYDGYIDGGIYDWSNRAIFGNFTPSKIKNTKAESRINHQFFSDTIFVEKYIQYLEEYSDTTFINKCFNEFIDEIKFYENLMQKEYKDYNYDYTFLYENARKIRQDLPNYKIKVEQGLYDNFTFTDAPPKIYNSTYHKMLAPEYIRVFTEYTSNAENTFKIINYCPYNIEIVGIGKNSDFLDKKFKESYIVNSYNDENNSKIFTTTFSGDYLFVSVAEHDTAFAIPILQWHSPQATSPRQEIEEKNTFPVSNYYTVENKKVIFNKGKYEITENIIIPNNYKVIIEAGTELDFINNSIFISNSPVYIQGEKNNKVLIKSSDGTAMGFTVLQCTEKSTIENTIFDGLNTLNYMGWSLTGAVNFYEADVEIKNTTFSNNKCEDALNIICSDFLVTNCSFNNIFSDAFDSDFSTGLLTNTTFTEIQNDAIDFSGSQVTIVECDINNVGDKGISGGESSNLIVKNCTVNNSKIGIASKDKSIVEIFDTKVSNSVYGLVAFQKKPEFGSAKIITHSYSGKTIINPFYIEKKSILISDGKIIHGTQKNVAKQFY